MSELERIAAESLFEMNMLGGFDLTDADIPGMKRAFESAMRDGHPLILHPNIAKDAVGKGFEEGVHFVISKPIPL